MNKLILLVEDNESDEKLTMRAFQRCGVAHEMVVQRDGAAALEWLTCTGEFADRDPAVQPAVVLLDINLPKIDGIELVSRIRANEATRSIPIVMMTSSGEQRDVERAVSAGANAYVKKPVDYTEFAEAARHLGMFWLSMNHRPPR